MESNEINLNFAILEICFFFPSHLTTAEQQQHSAGFAIVKNYIRRSFPMHRRRMYKFFIGTNQPFPIYLSPPIFITFHAHRIHQSTTIVSQVLLPIARFHRQCKSSLIMCIWYLRFCHSTFLSFDLVSFVRQYPLHSSIHLSSLRISIDLFVFRHSKRFSINSIRIFVSVMSTTLSLSLAHTQSSRERGCGSECTDASTECDKYVVTDDIRINIVWKIQIMHTTMKLKPFVSFSISLAPHTAWAHRHRMHRIEEEYIEESVMNSESHICALHLLGRLGRPSSSASVLNIKINIMKNLLSKTTRIESVNIKRNRFSFKVECRRIGTS